MPKKRDTTSFQRQLKNISNKPHNSPGQAANKGALPHPRAKKTK